MQQFYRRRNFPWNVCESQIIWLSDIEENLHKKFMELESQVNPSTPLEVLEEWRKKVTESMTNIEEAKELFGKVGKKFSQ